MVNDGVLSLTVQATDENLDKVLSFVEAKMEEMECSFKQINQVALALEEAYVNVAHYAYTDGGLASIELQQDGNVLTITLIDSGKPFDPLSKDEPDITLDAQDRQIGGLGIFLIKKVMTSVSYERKDNQNILTMVKDFNI